MIRYTGLNLHEALALPCDMFLLARRGFEIEQLSQTEEGRKYLEDVERLKKKKLDRDALHRLMEKLGPAGQTT